MTVHQIIGELLGIINDEKRRGALKYNNGSPYDLTIRAAQREMITYAKHMQEIKDAIDLSAKADSAV